MPTSADFASSNAIEASMEFNFDFTDLDFLSGCYEDGTMSNSVMPGLDVFFQN